jgi:hypothetical protein
MIPETTFASRVHAAKTPVRVFMIAKTFTPFLGVKPFAIMGFSGNNHAGVGHELLM